MRSLLRIALTAAVFLSVPRLATAQPAAGSITWQPEHLANGSPTLFSIELPADTTAVTARWQGHDLTFFRAPHSHTWYGLAGIDVEVAPGAYLLAVQVTRASGAPSTLTQSIAVEAAPYAEIPLTVPEKFVSPSPSALKRIAAEKTIKDKVFSSSASTSLWSGSFTPPLKIAPETDSFGTRRVFNGSLASIHRGLDYHARPGTPVLAVNSGRVVLAQPLYYEGNCIIIDHGLGLMTLYMHLSRFNVKAGTRVRRGQVIGLSGSSGRATGPHLHLGIRWQGAYVDAAKLFALQLPATH